MQNLQIYRWAVRAVALAASFCVAVIFALPGTALAAEPLRGVALVIGNGEYRHLSKLANPANDARGVEKLLSDLGFETDVSSDRDARRLKRDLEAFAEDAEAADVAVLYYSGHAIEAGGENFIVPIDADLSALDHLAEKLVPVSTLIAGLKAKVPVVIVLLDACRDNPFPPQAVARLGPGGDPLPIAATGLGLTRGARPVNDKAAPAGTDDENLGTLLGFAAEPGKVALDGAPGGNSPYAAAVLRHLATMSGEEFGTVMRMVAEEVYLKTGGKQRPWVNESMRRLLYFGQTSIEPPGDENAILKERRRLLLTIAALPDANRAQIERVAARGDVPLDALYGMLNVLGADTPKDPAALEKVLLGQTERLKQQLAERAALTSTDQEILRLAKLANEAVDEGALETALQFHEHAKARVKALQPTLDRTEADVAARRAEGAAVFGRSAAAYQLAFDYDKASQDYLEAFRMIAKWDRDLAFDYKTDEVQALINQGEIKGDNAALVRAVAASEEALAYAPRDTRPANWALSQSRLGLALWRLGERKGDAQYLERAAVATRAALEVTTRESAPLDWALGQNNLANILSTLGSRMRDSALLEESVTAYRAALEELPRETSPEHWSMAQNNLGTVLFDLGMRQDSVELLNDAVSVYQAALEERTRAEFPLEWAQSQTNVGLALREIGILTGDHQYLELSLAAYRAALEEYTQDRVPLEWAMVQNNLANVLSDFTGGDDRIARLNEAIAAYRAALEEYTRERVPLEWARTQNNLGGTLRDLGRETQNRQLLEQAVAIFRLALEERTRQRVPLDWAQTQNNLAGTFRELGLLAGDTVYLQRAISAHRIAQQEYTRDNLPTDWAMVQNDLGNVYYDLGVRETTTGNLEEAVKAYRSALEIRTKADFPAVWAETTNNLGFALRELGARTKDPATIVQAVEAFRAALDARRSDTTPQNWAQTQRNLGYALVTLGELAPDDDWMSQAATVYSDLVEHFDRTVSPADWAFSANALAYVRISVARRLSDSKTIARDLPMLRDALATQIEIDDYPQVADTLDTLCLGLTELGRAKADAALAKEAVDSCDKALTTMRKYDYLDNVATTEQNLATARALVAELAAR